MNRQERLERTMSMAQNKGLLNNPGENNCFLNSAVQVFWHLDVFRRSFREIKGHYCMGKSCIFCALENIFKEFQYSSNDALPPDTLRMAMASTFRDQRKFQMGDMDDAAECFENILSRMHFHLVMSEHDDGCNAQHCITHQKFAMHLIEQTICHCGERSEPLPFFQTVHYVSASALCAEGRKNEKLARPEYDYNKHFGTLLRLTGEDTKLCNGQDCGRRIQVQRLLLNCPDIISIGLNWDSESPDAEHIAEVLQCIGTTLKLPHIFHQVSSKTAQQATLHLVGIVTYYGKHYSTFFFHSKLQTWIYFDDAKVREIGPDWSVIRDKCRRCHYQPLLLLYANPNGTKINVATAPKEKIFINPSAIVRKTEISPMNRRISAEVNRLDYERHRKRSRPSSPESGLVESDSESNFSTLKSESKSKTKSSSTIEGSDDTLKARDTKEKTVNEDDNTLKAQDHSRIHRKDMVSLKDDKSPKSRRSKSCDWLEDGAARSSKTRIRGRTGSTGSDVTETLKRKHRDKSGKTKKTGLRRIGSAIFQAMKPAVAITHMKTSKKKSKDRASITSSNGELSPSSETTKQDGLRMNDQAQLDGYLRSPSHDSGIGSATGSVSSSDTNHGGSDDDLVEYSQTLSAMRNGYGINGKVNGRSRKAPPGQHHERCAYFLQEAENLVVQSQKAEKSSEYLNALRYCADAAKHFRRAADVSGPSSNNGRYALMKEEACKKQSESLREKFEAQSHNKMTRNLSPEDELRRTHRRDEMIMKQQQQNHAQFGTLQQRNIPTYKQIYPPPPSSSVSSKREDVASVKSDSRIIRPFHPPVATLPAKQKRNSSSHYVNRTSPYLNDRGSEGVCTQKIKPDSMCYSPNHYEDVMGRVQGMSLQSNGDVERRRSSNYPDVVRNGDRRSVYDNVIETETPKSSERRVSVAKIYLQPSGQRLSKSYDPSRYTNGEQDQVSLRQPKVYYQGASDSREQRSKSYGDNIDETCPYPQVPYNSMPPNYRPAPPSYQSYQQAKGTLNNSVVTTRPWYQEDSYSEQLSTASSPSNLRAISAKMIPDKLVCERCCQVPISRTQRICGGCEQETFLRHKKLTEATDMLY